MVGMQQEDKQDLDEIVDELARQYKVSLITFDEMIAFIKGIFETVHQEIN